MYTTGAQYPGIMAGQYAQQQQQYGQPDRSGLLANLRRPGPPASYPPYHGQQQQQSMQEMQHQHQIEMEIARMQLQNLELQKQLLMQAAANAQAQQQQQQQQPAVRRERMSTAPGQPRTFTDRAHDGYIDRDWRSTSPQYEVDEGVARRDALQTLERAQRQRHASAGGNGLPVEVNNGVPTGRGNRLSFGALGDGASLIESARARNQQSYEPPSSPVQSTQPVMSTPPPPQSIKAFASTPSPPRPTLVLSKPGEAFPQTSPSPPRKVGHVKTDSRSSSISSGSDHSSESEPHSFESAATSVGGNISIDKAAVVPKLNASAAAFTPSCAVAPPAIIAPLPSRPIVTPYRSKYAGLGNKGGDKNGVTVIRQPRGPAPDEELDQKNFASRIRRRALGAIRGRLSFIAADEE